MVAHEAADVAGIAIRIPAGGANDRLRPREVVRGVEERHDHERVIGNDMAMARILVVPIARFDGFPRFAPIRITFSPVPNIGDQLRDGTVWRDLREADFDQAFDVAD